MSYFLALVILFSSHFVQALDSQVTLSVDEMKVNNLVVMAGRGDKNEMLVVAARVFQLQLEASKCEDVYVGPKAYYLADNNIFSVKAKNCVIKNKKGEDCPSDLLARNISENPRTPDDGIIGGDKYKVCVKDNSTGSSGKSSTSKSNK